MEHQKFTTCDCGKKLLQTKSENYTVCDACELIGRSDSEGEVPFATVDVIPKKPPSALPAEEPQPLCRGLGFWNAGAGVWPAAEGAALPASPLAEDERGVARPAPRG